MKQLPICIVFVLAVTAFTATRTAGQSAMPEALTSGSLKDQLNYLQERTLIYENYRAIREDMFQKVKGNVSDTVDAVKSRVLQMKRSTALLKQTIDSLTKDLGSTKTSLDEMTNTKESIRVIGLEVKKTDYNRVMWTVIFILGAALIMGFLVFKRNMSVLSETKKDLLELKTEFETYRKTSREAREKLTMDHFNEIKKLKGG
jgi:hypothetical protein